MKRFVFRAIHLFQRQRFVWIQIRRLHILVSLMLSSQTKDVLTVAAMNRLLECRFDVQYGLDVHVDQLAKLIYPVGFWRVRSKDKFQRDKVDRSVCLSREKLNTSSRLVRFFARNTTTTFLSRSKNFALYLVRCFESRCRLSTLFSQFLREFSNSLRTISGVGPKMAYLSE